MALVNKVINKIASLANKLINFIGLVFGFFKNIVLFRFIKRNNCEAMIYVDIEEKELYRNLGRYIYNLLYFLTHTGNKAAFLKEMSFLEYCELDRYGRDIYKLDNVIFSSKIPYKTEDKILVSDRNLQERSPKKWKKVIQLNYNISLPRTRSNSWILMPFTMHPRIYLEGKLECLQEIRNTSRKMRIFFAGNTNYRKYSGSDILKKFDILPRSLIIQSIASGLESEVLFMEDNNQMQGLLNGAYTQKCVFLTFTDKDKGFTIQQKNWLEVLSKSEFFICPPGTTMPLCHNAIEAMAVGTIPIINYTEWFVPPLEHMKNCIRFSNEEDLVEQVKDVITMEQTKIDELRENVIEYYENHLSPTSFMEQMLHAPSDEMTLFVNAGNEQYLNQVQPSSVVLGRNTMYLSK